MPMHRKKRYSLVGVIVTRWHTPNNCFSFTVCLQEPAWVMQQELVRGFTRVDTDTRIMEFGQRSWYLGMKANY